VGAGIEAAGEGWGCWPVRTLTPILVMTSHNKRHRHRLSVCHETGSASESGATGWLGAPWWPRC
jgi:hypothetical protein